MRAGRGTRRWTPVVAVGVALVGVLGTSGVAVARMGPTASHRTAASSTLSATILPGRDLPQRSVTPEGAVQPSPLRSAAPPAAPAAPAAAAAPAVPAVAPLAKLQTPDVVVRATGPLPAEIVQRLRALQGVSAAALLDSATVEVGGADVALVGVDPSEFRAFTPQETAAADDLWQAVARGDVAAGFATAQQRSLALAATADVSGHAERIGALASFGLSGADLVASHSVAQAAGAVPGSVLVIAAPGLKTAALKRTVTSVVGSAAKVEVLRPADVPTPQLKGKPTSWRELYIASSRYCPGLSWTVLAAIGQIESGHGQNVGPSSAGALGPMQFMPATWAVYGVDGDGDGKADIMNPFDAVPTAARYLCANGAAAGPTGLYNAVFAYNHADWYVQEVLGLAPKFH